LLTGLCLAFEFLSISVIYLPLAYRSLKEPGPVSRFLFPRCRQSVLSLPIKL
jgi:hypothetical protein